MTPVPTSSEELAAILAARARALATPAQASTAGEAVELLAFAIGGARYALPTTQVAAVARLSTVTRVPGVTPAVAGVTNHEGSVLLIADLPALLGLPPSPTATDAVRYLLVVHDGDADPVGLVADEVHDIRAVNRAALYSPAAGGAAPLARAVTGDGCLVLDGKQLLTDPRLITATR